MPMPDPPPGAQRRLLARHLAGTGIELGPGHSAFPTYYPGVGVRYVDRWQPDENRALFRELGEDAPFPAPDIISNLDTDGLRAIEDASQDFVIASHVLEHVANPVALLGDIHRVLRPGGILLLLLPDRRRTFDRRRGPTSLNHLLDEHARGVDVVDDDHVLDFLVATEESIPEDPQERADLFDLHRRRSIHVHCWQEEEFFEVLVHAATALGHRWELIDAVLAEDEGPDGFEFGYVVRRSSALDDAAVLVERLRLTWRNWYEHRLWLHGQLAVARPNDPDPAADVSPGAAPTASPPHHSEPTWAARFRREFSKTLQALTTRSSRFQRTLSEAIRTSKPRPR